MGLLAEFRNAAVTRGRFPDDQRLTPAAMFSLVRDMPYERASAPTPEAVVAEWRGTCSGKHYLLDALYEDFGLASMLMVALHQFTAENTPWLPPELRAHLEAGPLPDVHTFLRLQIEGDWMTVDATWPNSAAALGLPVNARFEPGRAMTVACDPDEVFHIPPDADPAAFKQRIVEQHVGEHQERRDRFIEALSQWLATSTVASTQAS